VIIFDVEDNEPIAALFLLDLEYQSKLIVQPDGVLMLPLAFETLKTERLDSPQCVLVRGLPQFPSPVSVPVPVSVPSRLRTPFAVAGLGIGLTFVILGVPPLLDLPQHRLALQGRGTEADPEIPLLEML
jgi:hypothetical protein